MPTIPPLPPRRPARRTNAIAAAAVALALVLAVLWLHASDAPPAIPAGISVPTLPAPAPEATATEGLGQGAEAAAGDAAVRPAGNHRRPRRASAWRTRSRGRRHADGAGGAAEDDSRDPARENRLAPRQDPPATAPAPAAASGGGLAAPEFAIG